MSSHDYDCPSKYYEEQKRMVLYIETLTGTVFELYVLSHDTIASIKEKIKNLEGIPVSQQHLLYNQKELNDSSALKDYFLQDGATLKLVLSMRGGPISTVRRILPLDDSAWRELVNLNTDEMLDHLPAGCKMAILIFREGDHLNLLKVLENLDGSYSPISDISCGPPDVCRIYEEDDIRNCNKRLEENSVTMEKMNELKQKLEDLSLHRKMFKEEEETSETKKEVPSVKPSTKLTRSIHQLPPLEHKTNDGDQLLKSRSEFTQVPVLPNITANTLPEVSSTYTIVDSNDQPISRFLIKETRPKTSPDHLSGRKLCDILSEASRHRHTLLETQFSASLPIKSIRRSTSDMEIGPDWSSGGSLNSSVKTQHPFKMSSAEKLIPSTDCSQLKFRTIEKGKEFIFRKKKQPSNSSFRTTLSFRNELPRPTVKNNVFRDILEDTHRNPNLCSNGKISACHIKRMSSNSNLMPSSKTVPGTFIMMDSNGFGPAVNLLTPIYQSSDKQTAHESVKKNSASYESINPEEKSLEIDCFKCGDKLANNEHNIESIHLESSYYNFDKIEKSTTEPNRKKKRSKQRCGQCRKRLNLTNLYTCRCGIMFCSTHRYSETHDCNFDYKKEGRKILEQENPLINAPKLPKI
uniref:Ubiquitin-like domain-containing protein n=3 Tax=Clastoptera arizonana TaxID=38151 RepID=A0A1B6EFZ7_9HEMI